MKLFIKILLIITIIPVLFFWFKGSAVLLLAGDLLPWARLAGLLSVYSVLIQFLLMGRVKWIEREWGMDRLARIHHKNGKMAITLMIVHVVLILVSYTASSKINILSQLSVFFFDYPYMNQAIIAFILFNVIVFSSIYISKLKLPYELWYGVHFMTYLAIALAFTHQLQLGGDFVQNSFVIYWQGLYIFVFTNVIFYRFLIPTWRFFKYQFYVSKVISESGNVTSIYISGNNISALPKKAGQFIIVRFLDKSRFWQAHPFSLSGIFKDTIRLSIKNSGDFTSEISKVKVGTKLFIDGPHGGFTLERKITKKSLFIAGGIGITPIRSLIEQSDQNAESVLLYSNKDLDEAVFIDELNVLQQGKKVKYQLFITEGEIQKGMIGERININNIKQIVPDFKQRDIFICGPKAFIEAITALLLNDNVNNAYIHSEEFSLH